MKGDAFLIFSFKNSVDLLKRTCYYRIQLYDEHMLIKELSKWMNVDPTLIKERVGLFMEGFLWVHGFRISVHPGEESIQEKERKGNMDLA